MVQIASLLENIEIPLDGSPLSLSMAVRSGQTYKASAHFMGISDNTGFYYSLKITPSEASILVSASGVHSVEGWGACSAVVVFTAKVGANITISLDFESRDLSGTGRIYECVILGEQTE